MAHQMQLLHVGRLDERTVDVLCGDDLPSVENLIPLPKLELQLTLQLNRQSLKSSWGKVQLADALHKFLKTVDRRRPDQKKEETLPQLPPPDVNKNVQAQAAPKKPSAAIICMVCINKPVEYIFTQCLHAGVCSICREGLLAKDKVRKRDLRKTECPICRAKHEGSQIRRLFVVNPDQ
ncbi:uncharacterized protein LOC132193422 [Neocloeon triangulifer]|uniref:uncharacterized protein LOC132193422 n=1 Tax=Neocloeon triangulifer TaxID=2078957 RepID=UPI00286F0A4B|nr:uncharacterized protein LOC132193422 [Neocloeon triangulifer]